MIKKYFLDILSVFLVAIVAFLTAQKPVIDLNLRPSPVESGKLADTKKEETQKVQKGIFREIVSFGSLKERNIFSADGIYPTKKDRAAHRGPLPENPYTLVGILQGEEKKAVFRDYTGSIITLSVGKKLADGSVITNIEGLSVQLEKGKEKKELKLFDLTDPKRRVPPKPEIRRGTERVSPQKPGQEIRPRPERVVPQTPGQEIRPRPERRSRERPERARPQEQDKHD